MPIRLKEWPAWFDRGGLAKIYSIQTGEKIDHFAEELLGFVDKNFPQLSQAITAEAASRVIQVFTTKGQTRSANLPAGAAALFANPALQSSNGKVQDLKFDGTPLDGRVLNSTAFSNTAITPESSSSAKFFFFVMTSLIIAALMYFFYLRS